MTGELTIVEARRIDRGDRPLISYGRGEHQSAIALSASYLQHSFTRLYVPCLDQLRALLDLRTDHIQMFWRMWVELGECVKVVQRGL